MARTSGSTGETTAGAILDASLSLFARHGYAAVSMRTIAEAVGIQAGAIYNHFATKQSILLAIMTAHMDDMMTKVKETQASGSPTERLEAFARFHIRYNLARRDSVFVSYMELRALELEHFEQITGQRREYEAIPERLLTDPVFDVDDPHIAAIAMLSMLTGVTAWYREDGRLSPQQIEDIYAGLVLRSVGVTPAMSPKGRQPAHV